MSCCCVCVCVCVEYSAHMQDLQEITHEVHYENYRSEKMSSGAAARKIKSVYARIRPDSTGTRLLRAFEVAKMLRGCRE